MATAGLFEHSASAHTLSIIPSESCFTKFNARQSYPLYSNAVYALYLSAKHVSKLSLKFPNVPAGDLILIKKQNNVHFLPVTATDTVDQTV